jgi:hypothetical protein
MDKRGEFTSTQVATWVVIIVGFAIAVFFIYNVFNNKDLAERDACRLSLLARATVPSALEQELPLNCQSQKICITLDKSIPQRLKETFTGAAISEKSECEQFAGEENVGKPIKVNLDNPLGAAQKIQEAVANAMYDCWLMTGEGKLDIFSGKYKPSDSLGDKWASDILEWTSIDIPQIKPACLVCSKVAFSKELTSDSRWASVSREINYNRFLSTQQVPQSSLTYLQTFTDQGVGSGYGAIEQTENKLTKYAGDTSLTPAQVPEIRAVLNEQFRNNPVELKKINDMNDEALLKYVKSMPKIESKASSQIAIVFAQIKVPKIDPNDQFWSTFRNGAVLGGAAAISGPGKVASFFIPGPGWMKALYKIAAVGGTSLALAFEAEGQTEANQALSAATCGNFSSTRKDQMGCSLVKLMNWDVNSINSLCTGGIEGI